MTLLTGLRAPLSTIALFLVPSRVVPTTITLRRTGLSFEVREPMDAWVVKETCLDRDYFRDFAEPAPDWRILDIGAGLGDFTVLAASLAPDGVVHAYEPFADSFALLGRNLRRNGITTATIHNEAAAARDGTRALLPGRARAGMQVFGPGEGIEATSLARILDRLPGRRCDFMKIDCEGGEFDLILNGADQLHRVDRIALEYHEALTNHTSDELIACLRSEGFVVRRARNPVHANTGFLFAERP
ncbi:FkbM family methyltransferase [Pelagovum pacificum]|uniref:FkbM family methyltransferase n=1 Tax=Pelagovum pacificum TaxID=2588711 RepID=UPI0018CCE690|nr:FkbM family methyltransferase [Pelagovum pacificum]